MSSNYEDVIYENLQDLQINTNKYNTNSIGYYGYDKNKFEQENNFSFQRQENTYIDESVDAIYENIQSVQPSTSNNNNSQGRFEKAVYGNLEYHGSNDYAESDENLSENEEAIYGNIDPTKNERTENYRNVDKKVDSIHGNIDFTKNTVKTNLQKSLNEALCKRIVQTSHNKTAENSDTDEELDAFYSNLDVQKVSSNERESSKLSINSNPVIQEDDVRGNVSYLEKETNQHERSQHDVQYQRNLENKQSSSDESLDDDFDSDNFYSEPEEIDHTKPFPIKITLDALPLKDVLENQQFQNLQWSEVMDKLHVNIYQIDDREKYLQNMKYQLAVAEWSFLKSMNILQEKFMDQLFILLSYKEKDILFAHVEEVRDCSQNFMTDIQECWVNNKFNDNFCEILHQNLRKRFEVYVQYTANQIYSEALLGELISDKNRTFNDFLDDIQKDPICNGLHLHAYQLIPVRKINSLPHLLENISKCLTPRDKEYEYCRKTLESLKLLLDRCDSETKKSKDHLRTKTILEKLEFPKNMPFGINNTYDVQMRRFIKSDKMELIEITTTLFGKKLTRKPVYVFLFSDILIVARQRNSSNKYQVLDYSFRINIELNSTKADLHFYTINLNPYTVLYLHIKENRDLKETEMILNCGTQTDAIRWMEALDPPDTAKETDHSFDFKFIKNVVVRRNYLAVHSDEINLIIGDVFKILRETNDGWSFGQREKDGECGWFQTENVALIDNNQKNANEKRPKNRLRN